MCGEGVPGIAAGIDDGVEVVGGAETILGICERFQLLPGQRGI